MIKNRWMIFGVVTTAILCAASGVYDETEGTMTALQLLQKAEIYPETIDEGQFQMIMILRRLPGGYLALFAPVVTAIPFVMSFRRDRMNQFQRLLMFRKKSAYQYYCEKIAVGVVCGGILLTGGILLFHIFLCGEMKLFYDGTVKMTGGSAVSYVRYYAGIFCYGMESSVLGIGICFLTENLYFVMCLPFIIVYLYNLLVQRFLNGMLQSAAYHRMLLEAVGYLYSFSVADMFFDKNVWAEALACFLLLAFLIFAVPALYIRGKLDCGGAF